MNELRRKYTWHLRPPFDVMFDGIHWWEKVSRKEIHPIAALYELARRHPRVGELRSRFRHRSWHGCELTRAAKARKLSDKVIDAFDDLGAGPKSLHCLCLIGLKSWVQLDPRDHEYWAMSGGRLKGLDCRSAVEQCSSITAQALTELFLRRMHALKPKPGAMQYTVPVAPPGAMAGDPKPVDPKAHEKATALLADSIKKQPFTREEMEEAVLENARAAHRQGDFVFSVAPNLSIERAAEILSALYRDQQERDYGDRAQPRARWTDWLPTISEFEATEQIGGAKAPVFTRYRRVLDGLDFEPEFSQTQKLTGWI